MGVSLLQQIVRQAVIFHSANELLQVNRVPSSESLLQWQM